MQFPIRLAFAMTINKSQGQSLNHVGVDLCLPVFTHGQLYVALSRMTNVSNLSILFAPENSERITENVVYPEVLQAFSNGYSYPSSSIAPTSASQTPRNRLRRRGEPLQQSSTPEVLEPFSHDNYPSSSSSTPASASQSPQN
jgi:hypothetical protein